MSSTLCLNVKSGQRILVDGEPLLDIINTKKAGHSQFEFQLPEGMCARKSSAEYKSPVLSTGTVQRLKFEEIIDFPYLNVSIKFTKISRNTFGRISSVRLSCRNHCSHDVKFELVSTKEKSTFEV